MITLDDDQIAQMQQQEADRRARAMQAAIAPPTVGPVPALAAPVTPTAAPKMPLIPAPSSLTDVSPVLPPVQLAVRPAGPLIPPPPPATPTAPAVTIPAVSPRVQADVNRLDTLRRSGSGIDQILHPVDRTTGIPTGAQPGFGHKLGATFARIADVAGSSLFPTVMAAIPGTTLHNRMLIGQAEGNIAQDLGEEKEQQGQQKTAADIAQTEALTKAVPITAQLKRMAAQGALAQHGLTMQEDENGNTSVAWDETSPVYKAFQSKQELAEAQIANARAQQDLREAQAEYNKAKTNPNSPLFKQTAERLAIMQGNANAAQKRATAYMGQYLERAYNKGIGGDTLPGAPVISNEGGEQTIVGTGNAGQAVKSQANAAQFNDVHGSLDNLDNAARALTAAGEKPDSAAVAAALAQPKGTVDQWIQGQVAKGNLSPVQRDYVTTIVAAHENIQGLRKSAGGTATDSSVDRLIQMLPGPSTPDLDYFLRQTAQIRATADRIGKGATTAAGGLSVRGQRTTPAAGAGPNNTTTVTGMGVSMTDARKLPAMKGKSDAEIRQAIQAAGHRVVD